jgi:hypothetical protein
VIGPRTPDGALPLPATADPVLLPKLVLDPPPPPLLEPPLDPPPTLTVPLPEGPAVAAPPPFPAGPLPLPRWPSCADAGDARRNIGTVAANAIPVHIRLGRVFIKTSIIRHG